MNRIALALWLVLAPALAFAQTGDVSNPQTDASKLTAGTLPAARGGTGISNAANLTVTTATSVGRGQYQGTNAADNATAGNVGETQDTGLQTVSTALTTGTSANCTSISLTAGDWNVSGAIGFTGGATTTVQALAAGLSTTTGTLPNNSTPGFQQLTLGGATAFATRNPTMNTGINRFSLSSTTTVFLVGRADFGTSTLTLNNCEMIATRIR